MKDLVTLGVLLREAGYVEGRKKLQKIVHILQEGGVDFHLDYEFSHFGPYSQELKAGVDELVAADLVKESRIPDSPGFRYEITDRFKTLLNHIGEQRPAWSEYVVQMKGMEAKELEGMSTILFLSSKGWSNPDLTDRFCSLKPHLAENVDHFYKLAVEYKSKIRHHVKSEELKSDPVV